MRLFNRVRSCTSDCSWPTAAVGMPTRSELEAPSNHEARRVLLVGWVMIGLVSVAMIGLLLRVVQLQTMPLQAIDQLVDSQSSRRTLKARRGSLLDRVGRPIAVTQVVQQLYIDPQLIHEPGTFSEQVGYTLGYDPAWVEKTISPRRTSRYVVIDPHIDDDLAMKVLSLNLQAVATEPHVVREYPQGSLAAALIGFVGTDGVGLEGLELGFERELAGCDGTIRYLRDARHRPLWVEASRYVSNRDGRTIHLTLDMQIQLIAERELAKACKEYAAESGQLIVMDPQTGQTLAMVNWPGFDLSDISKTKPAQRRNRCVTDVYEPGSTFKAFIWAAMVDAGVADPLEMIDSDVSPPGRRLRDTRNHGRITVEQVLIKSSNRGMGQLGLRLGAKRLHDAVCRFGFGVKPGSGAPGEVSGIVHPLAKWTKYSVTSIPMGQEIAASPLQMTRAFCALANGGVLVSPTIRLTESTARKTASASLHGRAISRETADHTRQVLRRVVTEGTGRRANSDLYRIFGKTGTAQIAENGRYIPGQYVGSFIGGAPLDDPQIVVACVIHRPDSSIGYYGGTVAGPAVRAVIEQSLIYLGVAPQAEFESPVLHSNDEAA